MGTINYGTSDYITIGLKPYDASDYESDAEFMSELEAEVEEYGGTVKEALQSYLADQEEEDYYNITGELNSRSFYYFHIVIKSGYYEGFYIDIENNFPVAFDNWTDKRDAQKEVTQIRQFLRACAGLGLVSCRPGWCTGYSDYKKTLQEIDAAIREMRTEIRTTPTWEKYTKAEA